MRPYFCFIRSYGERQNGRQRFTDYEKVIIKVSFQNIAFHLIEMRLLADINPRTIDAEGMIGNEH